MKIRVMSAVFACKTARWLLRTMGRGGTDFPGRVALKICPNLLGELAKNVTTIVVTGTNGKTTTSRMVEQMLKDAGISYFANKTGANLLGGVTAEFAVHSSFTGVCRYSHAVIESDEAAFKHISKSIDAKAVLVTNVFRDQLDRFGEITKTLDSIRIGIGNSKNAVVCLNGDDSLCTSLGEGIDNEVRYYGVNVPLYKNRVTELSDAPYCIHCQHPYDYSFVTYGHLGGYSCPNCGYHRPEPNVCVTALTATTVNDSSVVVKIGEEEYAAKVNLPGGYNIYNACGALCVGDALGIDRQTAVDSLNHFACGFGRMEKFDLGETQVRMILIKNPAGCNQVLNFLSEMTEPFVFTVCLNDRTQDGKDISWIWDVDFEKLIELKDMLKTVYVSGIRADEMAMRFYYAGFPAEKIRVVRDYDTLTTELEKETVPAYVMPTYTAMLDMRAHMSKKYGFGAYWE